MSTRAAKLFYKNNFEFKNLIVLHREKSYIGLNDNEICILDEGEAILCEEIDNIEWVEVKRIFGGGASLLFSGRYGGDTSLYNLIYREVVLKFKSRESGMVEVAMELGDDSINMATEERIKILEGELKKVNKDILIKRSYKHFFK